MDKLMTPEQEELLIQALQEISTGRDLEAFFFGDKVKGADVPPKMLPLISAFLEVLRVQHSRFDWNAQSPVPIASSILFRAVRKHLHRAHLKKQLRLFVAVGTSLDWHHHMDAVFATNGRFIGIDITGEQRDEELDMKDAIAASRQLPIVVITKDELSVPGGFDAVGKKIAARFFEQLSPSARINQSCWFDARQLAFES